MVMVADIRIGNIWLVFLICRLYAIERI